MACVLALLGCQSLWAANSLTGLWNGTWEGGGSGGRFDLTITLEGDGKRSGGVSVGQEAGDYVAQFSTLIVAEDKLTATYDFPGDLEGEIVLSGTFDGDNATGTWVLRPKGREETIADGTWKCIKK